MTVNDMSLSNIFFDRLIKTACMMASEVGDTWIKYVFNLLSIIRFNYPAANCC